MLESFLLYCLETRLSLQTPCKLSTLETLGDRSHNGVEILDKSITQKKILDKSPIKHG